MEEELTNHEVEIKPGLSEKSLQTTVKFPGKDQTVKFQVMLPKLANSDDINNQALMDLISKKLKQTLSSKLFLDKMMHTDTRKIRLAEVIANAVSIHLVQSQDITIEKILLQLEIRKDQQLPEVIVKPSPISEKYLQSIVKFPGLIDKSIAFEIPISMDSHRDVDQLTNDISNAFAHEDVIGISEIDDMNTIPKPTPGLPPCTEVNSDSTIDLRSGQLTIPGLTCTVQNIDCSSLPMTFYSFSGKLAESTSKQIHT